jgi:hypothetical protein
VGKARRPLGARDHDCCGGFALGGRSIVLSSDLPVSDHVLRLFVRRSIKRVGHGMALCVLDDH